MNSISRKIIVVNAHAAKEIAQFPIGVQARFNYLFEILRDEGKLEMPYAKKIRSNIFEIRVQYGGQWRATYAYVLDDKVVILSAFQKKTQRMTKQELEKAMNRLKSTENQL